jgi:hypothetical protein
MNTHQPALLRVSDNGRHFVDAQDQPFFYLCDTAWPLFSQYSLSDAEQYLARRAEQGFNVVKGVLAWPLGTEFEQPVPQPNYRGDLPWLDNNPATPNAAYFDHVEHLLKVAAQHGLILNMLPNWGYHVNNIQLITEESASIYGKWLGQRFKGYPNIIWTLGGDRKPLGYEDVYRAMAHGLREGDGGTHLMTYHPSGAASSGRYFHNEDWLDFNLIQTWDRWDRIYPAVLSDVVRTPTKPVVMDEGAYEDGPEYPTLPITPLLVRRQAWLTFMAGGYHTYGHNASWRPDGNWIAGLDAVGANQMRHFFSIATSRRWWEMTPAPCLINDGANTGKFLNAALRTSDCTAAMVYSSHQCNILISTFEMAPKRVKATWANPATGELREIGMYEMGNHWFTTPNYWEDAVLLLGSVS